MVKHFHMLMHFQESKRLKKLEGTFLHDYTECVIMVLSMLMHYQESKRLKNLKILFYIISILLLRLWQNVFISADVFHESKSIKKNFLRDFLYNFNSVAQTVVQHLHICWCIFKNSKDKKDWRYIFYIITWSKW